MTIKDKQIQIEEVRTQMIKKLKGKPFKNLNTPDKDYLLESIGKILGLMPEK